MAVEQYGQAILDLNEAYRNGLRAFTKWCGEHWKIGPNDTEIRTEHGPAYVKGFNAGIEAVDAALDCFLEEWCGG